MIIGLVGRSGSGKNTFARMLTEELGALGVVDVKTVAIADPIKQLAVALNPCLNTAPGRWEPLSRLGDIEFAKREYPAARQLIQRLGRALVAVTGDDVWLDMLPLDAGNRLLIVSDVRYPHEANYLASRGAALVAVTGITHRTLDPSSARHSSEAALAGIDCDLRVRNDRGFDELRAQARRIAQLISEC